jgi:transglutaminase-like putative cysteine protease
MVSTRVHTGRQAIDYFFDLALFLFVSTGFVAVAATGKLDWATVIVVSCALVYRGLAFVGLSDLRLKPDTVRTATIVYIFFYVADFFLISRNFVSATGHLLFFLLVMKLFSAVSNRDYVYLGVMAFMEMLLAAILTINTSFLGLFVVFLLFGIATFTSFEIKRGYSTGGRPAEISGNPSGFLRGVSLMSAFVTLGVMIAGAALFFFIPRVTTGYLSNLAQSQTISGFSDTVTLGDLGTIKQSSAPVMHVKIIGGPHNMPVLRWRGKAYVHFDGHRWTDNTSTIIIPPSPTYPGRFDLPGAVEKRLRRSENMYYSVTLEPISTDTIFLAQTPLSVTGRFRSVEVDATDSVLSHDSNFAGLRYDAVSNLTVPTPAELRTASTNYPADMEANLQLPPLDPRIRELALQITAKTPAPYEKASAIELYLRTKLGYTLDMIASGPDPIADFLFNVRKGHCEYFAASMTVMLRSLGIPAREVGGFLGGEYNDVTEQYVVRGSDAHNWVEAFFPGYGWISFDPTPAAGTDPSSRQFTGFAKYLDAARTFWNDWVVAYDFSRQFQVLRQMDRGSRQITNDLNAYARRRYEAIRRRLQIMHHGLTTDPQSIRLLILLAAALAVLVLLAPRIYSALLQLQSKMRVRAGRASARDVTVAYERFLMLMSKRGLERAPATTPSQFARDIPDPVARKFTVVFEEARYGGATERLPELYRLLAQLERPDKHTVLK